MINFLLYTLFFYSFWEFFIYYLIIYDEDLNLVKSYLFFFLFFFYFNYNFNITNDLSKLDVDLLYKFIWFFLKIPSRLVNYIINIFKKIWTFLVYFKYRDNKNLIIILSKQYTKFLFLYWRPLFKKTSYFGYYRSNRSKWIK